MDEDRYELPVGALDGLAEPGLPELVAFTPQTPAAWLLIGAALALALWAVLAWTRAYRRRAYRREALAELDQLASRGTIHDIPALLRRVALSAYPRAEVASLTGTAWGEFLRRTAPGAGIDAELGAAIEALAYRSSAEGLDPDRAVSVTKAWIRGHSRRAHA